MVFSLSLFLAGLEIMLRVLPWVIPAKALIYFEPELRSRLAKGRFPTRADTMLLERDDGGQAIRIFKPYAVKPYAADSSGSVRAVPTDELGFGNPPGLYQGNSRLDLIAIGDSFTWPSAVSPEDAWPMRLGRALDCTAYNLGRGGTGPYEYLQILKRFGLPKSPRIVVLNIYEGNDLWNVAEHLAYCAGVLPSKETDDDWCKTGWLWRRSRAWNFLAGSYLYLRDDARIKRLKGRVDYRFGVGTIPFNTGQAARDEVVAARQAIGGGLAFAELNTPLKEFKRLAEEHGFRAVVSYVPAAAIAYSPVVFRDPAVGEVLERFSQGQRRHLQRVTKELDLEFADLTPVLQEIACREPATRETLLYFPGNIHLTPRGHAVVAEALARFLEEDEAREDGAEE